MFAPPEPPLPGGSSPLARGLLGVSLGVGDSRGIIPARAGFTHVTAATAAPRRDHPRSRGVYEAHLDAKLRGSGSSPLARGLHSHVPRTRSRGRIIPARAGFTSRTSLAPSSTWDHPRSRGVYLFLPMKSSVLSGSSPLARGLLAFMPKEGGDYGIIPARAGFTARRSTPARKTRDHPRSRGVYAVLGVLDQ